VIVFDDVTVRFGSTVVIERLALEIRPHEITTLLAPSGAGKTTLLRLIAGLTSPTTGRIVMNSVPVTGPSPDIGFILQEPSVFPWLTARDNLRFGLRLRANRRHAFDAATTVTEIAQALEIEDRLDLFASRLSGGEKQRVVIGRALVLEPAVLLCDEPFSQLDELTRQGLREMLQRVYVRYKPTIVFVTHSIEEAIFLGHRVIIFARGPLRQLSDLAISTALPRESSFLLSQEFQQAEHTVREVMHPRGLR
jgi:NitT/TauT family transport system ATP-binding protein